MPLMVALLLTPIVDSPTVNVLAILEVKALVLWR